MSERSLPLAATLRYLKLEAKRFLKAAHAADSPRGKQGGALKLAEAQHLIARDYGFASWALLKLRVAELEFARGDREQQRAALIDAVCAWGWDHDDVTATADLAEAIVGAAPSELVRGDFLLACITGELDAVRAALEREPTLATTPVEPRNWEPLLYVSYSMLLRKSERAARIVEVAKLLLAHGANPNCHYVGTEYSFPALYASIAVTSNLALTAVLLEHEANPNDGQSLYHAAERFDTEALDLLFAHGIDPADISYCLLHKIDFQHAEGIRWFLDHGADPNARHPKSSESSLHWAIKRASKLELIELLLERGADPDARTLEGHTVYPEIRAWTALDLAKRLARTDIVAVLRARGAAETPPTDADTVVFACIEGAAITREQIAELAQTDRELIAHIAQQNRTAAVVHLVELGWPLDVQGWMAATPLHWAACRGNAGLARTLLASGAPLVDVGGYFKTPLNTALYGRWSLGDADYVGVLEALVAAGIVLPQTLDPTGSAALDAAIARLRR